MITIRKRTVNDATAPIIKPCFIDVDAIWSSTRKKTTVSKDLTPRVIKALSKSPEKV